MLCKTERSGRFLELTVSCPCGGGTRTAKFQFATSQWYKLEKPLRQFIPAFGRLSLRCPGCGVFFGISNTDIEAFIWGLLGGNVSREQLRQQPWFQEALREAMDVSVFVGDSQEREIVEQANAIVNAVAGAVSGISAELLPDAFSVGVQGDGRVYRPVLVLIGPHPGWEILGKLSDELTNTLPISRVTLELADRGDAFERTFPV